jgi:hypothetical protein
MSKFKKGDICICSFTLRRKVNSSWIEKNDCLVRIIKAVNKHANGWTYGVYNIDFQRYERIGGFYLKLDISEMRNQKLNELLD